MKTTLLLSVLCAAMAVAASQTCGSATCAPEEYCDNSAACVCNTSLFNNSGSQPSPNLTCDGGSFNIQVSKCWLEANGYNTSDIRLNSTNSKCWAVREIVDGISQMTIHSPLTKYVCDTDTVVNTTHITYTNQLNIFSNTGPIITQNDAAMNVSCSYPLYMNVKLNVTLHPILGSAVINGPTNGTTYTAVMAAFKESTYTDVLKEEDTVTVESTIYLSVIVPDLDANTFNLSVVNIYASPTNSSSPKYYLLKDGCPSNDISTDQLKVDKNGVGIEARFPMKVFKITSSNTVYLYAELRLCTNDCATCPSVSRSARSQNIAGKVSLYLDAADSSYDTDVSSASGFSMPWTLSALISSWILMKLM